MKKKVKKSYSFNEAINYIERTEGNEILDHLDSIVMKFEVL